MASTASLRCVIVISVKAEDMFLCTGRLMKH